MVLNIEQDHLRFREIVRGRIKQDLKKYISNSEMIGRKGKDYVSIPVPQIELPNFRFGSPQGGVGQGDEGDLNGSGQAGNSPGAHILEVDLSMDELAQIMGEELELPRIEPKGTDRITTVKDKYSQVSRVWAQTFSDSHCLTDLLPGHFEFSLIGERVIPKVVPRKLHHAAVRRLGTNVDQWLRPMLGVDSRRDFRT